MPVEVVRLEVEQNGDPGPKLVDVLELEARELADDPLVGLDLADQLAERTCRRSRPSAAPSIAPSSSVVVVFPFVPVTPTIGFGSSRARELDLAPDRDPTFARRDDERRLARHTGALHEHVDTVQQAEIRVVAERTVGGDDLRAFRLERRLRRQPRAREPEHERAFHVRRKSM